MNGTVIQRCVSAISRLPQGSVLKRESVRRWLLTTARLDADRLEWHVARAGGVGGSEAGSLLAWRFPDEEFSGRDTASRLAKNKLFLLPPSRGNDDTERGIAMEDFVRLSYERKLTKLGVTWTRRDDIKSIIEAGPHPNYRWMRASTDGVYEIDGEIHIVDFKAPSSESLKGYVSRRHFPEYEAQLNHYACVAAGRGVTIHRLSLVMFDYARAGTNGVHVFDIDNSLTLQDKIIEASGLFWNEFVCRGHIPAALDVRDDRPIPDDVEAAAKRILILNTVKSRLEDTLDNAKSDMAAWVREGDIPVGKIIMGHMGDEDSEGLLNITHTSSLNVDAAVERLLELGLSPDHLRDMRTDTGITTKSAIAMLTEMRTALQDIMNRTSDAGLAAQVASQLDRITGLAEETQATYDAKKVEECLVECGEEAYMFRTATVVQRVSQKKRADKAALIDRLENVADEFVNHIVTCELQRYEVDEANGLAMVA